MLRNGSGGTSGVVDVAASAAGDAPSRAPAAENQPPDHAAASTASDDGAVGGGAVSGLDLPLRCRKLDQPARPGKTDTARRPTQPDAADPLSLPRLNREALAELGRDELLAVLGDVERLVNQAAGYRAQVLGALDALNRSGAAPDASPHLTLRDAAGVSEREARRMTRAAQKARRHGAVLDALSGGDINTAQAEVLCDARVPDGVRHELVAAAAVEDTDATRRRVRQAEADHCVETSMERFERQRKVRGAGWQRDHEGMLRLWAKFDPHTGAQIEAMLEPLRREFWSDDKQVRNGRRSPAQRDADVLAYALAGVTCTDADAAAVERLHARARRRGRMPDRDEPRPSQRTTPRKSATRHTAAHQPHAVGAGSARPDQFDNSDAGREGFGNGGDPARRLPPAQISVLIGLDALCGHSDEMGLTDAGTELPPETVRQLACDAEVIPVILSGPGGPADIGRASRTVPRRLRRLLVARDRHCRWPGCSAPPSRCDAHHIIHWLNGGPTDLDNLVLLCHRHHQHLHKHGYRIILDDDGSVTIDQEPGSAPPVDTAQPRGP